MPDVLAKSDNELRRVFLLARAVLKDKGKVRIQWGPPRRSDSQNRYLWAAVYPAILEGADEGLRGWTAKDLHEYFLGEWGGWEELHGMGRTRLKPVHRSSKLNRTEFSDYLGFIQQKAAEMGIFVPDPE